MQDPFVWATIILGICAALGPIVGVRYGMNWHRDRKSGTELTITRHKNAAT